MAYFGNRRLQGAFCGRRPVAAQSGSEIHGDGATPALYPGEPTPHLFNSRQLVPGEGDATGRNQGTRDKACGKGHCGSTERHLWEERAGGNGFWGTKVHGTTQTRTRILLRDWPTPGQGPHTDKTSHGSYLNHMHIYTIHFQPFRFVQVAQLSLRRALSPMNKKLVVNGKKNFCFKCFKIHSSNPFLYVLNLNDTK